MELAAGEVGQCFFHGGTVTAEDIVLIVTSS